MNENFQIPQATDLENFVKYWSGVYDYANEPLYTKNINKPLTEESIRELFLWKNGRKLSKRKQKSVDDHYVSKIKELGQTQKDIKPEDWFEKFSGGGAIWSIFFFHIWNKDFPIFDQHVYRAMKFIQTGDISEIPPNNDTKIQIYLEQYLPFYRKLSEKLKNSELRDLDRALWKFGQFLKWLEPPGDDETDEISI